MYILQIYRYNLSGPGERTWGDIVPTFCYRVDTERERQGAVGQKKSEGMLWGNKVVHKTSLCFLHVKRLPCKWVALVT